MNRKSLNNESIGGKSVGDDDSLDEFLTKE